MLTKEEMELPDRVAASFGGQTVVITGGTGFMGKVLVEKILRKCPDVKQIILLIRHKKGKTSTERLLECLKNPLFDTVRDLRGGYPALLAKMSTVTGDVAEADLGLSPADRKTLTDNADIIVHCAATIRFDEALKKAVLLNTRGTKLMLQLGKDCKHLKIFVHISTAYCHLHVKLLEEKAYASPDNPHEIIKTMENLDDEAAESITPKLLNKLPNSYAYSKALSEGLAVEAIEQGLPVIILRPSIVIPIFKDPVPGWADNINGPMGLLIGAGKGVIRTMYCKSDGYADYLPVDVLINGIMIAVWNFVEEKDQENRIMNFTSSAEIKFTYTEVIELGRKIVETKVPLNWVAWYPGGSMKHNRFYHNVCLILYHWIPALLVDGILLLVGQKPILMRVQRRIAKGFEVFEYYTNNQWDFKSDIGQEVRKKLNAKEKDNYKCDTIDVNIEEYFTNCIMAARRLILKESDESLPTARRHMKVMWCVDRLFTLVFYGLILYWFYNMASSYFGFNFISTSPEPIRELNY